LKQKNRKKGRPPNKLACSLVGEICPFFCFFGIM